MMTKQDEDIHTHEAFDLTTYDRCVLDESVLAFSGGSFEEKLRTIYVRRQLRHSDEEAERLHLQHLGLQDWRWRGAGETTQIELTTADAEHIRKSLRLMGAAGAFLGDNRFDDLMLKFLSLDDLEDLRATDEDNARRR